MIADALKYLADLARTSAAPVELPDGDPRYVRHVIDGKVVGFDRHEPPRDHRAGSLDDIIQLATRFAESSMPVVWYDDRQVVLVIDDDGHRVEKATLALEESDAFKLLAEIRAGRGWFEQKAFVRLLRIELAGTLDPGLLLEKVRRLRFENGSVVNSEVGRQRESLGREITSKVEAGGELPDEVTLLVPVYKTAGEREAYGLRCTVDVDPPLGRLQLLPLPDEVERVRQLALDSIGSRLAGGLPESVPAYHGRP